MFLDLQCYGLSLFFCAELTFGIRLTVADKPSTIATEVILAVANTYRKLEPVIL